MKNKILKLMTIFVILSFSLNLLASEQVVPVKQESRVERFARYVRNVGVTSTLLAAASSVYPYISSYLPSLSAYVPTAATQLAVAAAGVVTAGVGQTFNYLAGRDRADAEAKAPPKLDAADEFVDANGEFEPWMEPYVTESMKAAKIPVEKKELDVIQQLATDLLGAFKTDFNGELLGAEALISQLKGQAEANPERVLQGLHEFMKNQLSEHMNYSAELFGKMEHFRIVLQTVCENLVELKRTPSGNVRAETPELEEDWEVIETTPDNGTIPQRLIYRQGNNLHIHPVLSKGTYNDLLQITDLSYKFAAEFRAPSHNDKWREMKEDLMADLVGRGWRHFATIDGKTGFNNANDDKTAIVMINREQNLVAVGFHGSISLDYSQANLWNGDWAANWDSVSVDASEVGIEGADGVKVHRGFGRNYQSARKALLYEVGSAINTLKNVYKNAEWPTVFVVGHSKGAAMASLAVADIKQHLYAQADMPCHVAAMLISAPKAMELSGRNWVNRVVGTGNVLRMNVWGDPATKQSFLYMDKLLGFRKHASVGVLLQDTIDLVRSRTEKLYGHALSRKYPVQWNAGYHYAAYVNACGDYVFSPRVVMTYEELPRLIKAGVHYQLGGNPDFLHSTILGGSPDIEDVLHGVHN